MPYEMVSGRRSSQGATLGTLAAAILRDAVTGGDSGGLVDPSTKSNQFHMEV